MMGHVDVACLRLASYGPLMIDIIRPLQGLVDTADRKYQMPQRSPKASRQTIVLRQVAFAAQIGWVRAAVQVAHSPAAVKSSACLPTCTAKHAVCKRVGRSAELSRRN